MVMVERGEGLREVTTRNDQIEQRPCWQEAAQVATQWCMARPSA
jgi:hypothetical protein